MLDTRVAISSVTGSITVNSLGGDDNLTIDFSGGAITPDLTFNGGFYDGFLAKVSLALTADRSELSAATGGTVHFSLFAGKDNAGRSYLLVGSMSGTDPGTPLPGGMATLPLNWDLFTNLVISLMNTPFFSEKACSKWPPFFVSSSVAGA